MNPIAFTILGFEIRWYGLLIALGMLAAGILASFTSKLRDVNYDNFLDTALIAIPFGVIGARLYYVIFNFGEYRGDLIQVFNIRNGGLAIHGGIILSLTAAYLFTRRKKYDFISMADVAAPSIILAQAMGRWGNFFNGEAHGGPVTREFISHFPNFIQKGMYIDGTYYHPTFLYESLWDLLVCGLLLLLLKKSKRKGLVIFSYVGLYSIGRFFIEGLRTDSLMLGPLRMAQLVSLAG
ncbi:MAG: prolipoprotein diacylglyceryl transferase, partial [Bacillota bacterium]|nr:prolipoprotein diacylglyceryl transferase [Bacillota bacterium]